MYDVGWAYYDMEDYGNSIAAFERLVAALSLRGYRGSRALFQIGEAHFRARERYREAIPQSTSGWSTPSASSQMSEREILVR